jgi:outer membrane receptor protein involved in Fe transport
MARFTLLFFIMLVSAVTAFGQTSSQSLQGTVTDETGEVVMFANVALYKNGALITGTQTDFDGKYSFNDIDAGTYDIVVSYVGYSNKRIADVVVFAGKSITLNVEISQGIELDVIEVVYQVPLVEQDNTTQGTVVTSKEIDKLASKNINGIIAQSAGVSSADEGDAITIRGSRSNATDYYIDGIRVSGAMIPQSEIEQLQVITGGIPASIGDVTGGVISVTTKGPSRNFSGTAEIETSEFLDGYQYRLGMLSLAGPILKKKNAKGERTGESIIGYRFSGQYRSRGDRDPSAVGIYKIKDDVYEQLSENPLTLLSSGGSLVPVPAANFLTEDDVELVNARPNSADVRYDATGKVDIRLNKNMDIAIGGSFNHRQAQPITNSLLNFNRNRTEYNTDARGFFRFRHRIGGATTSADADAAKTKGASIQNASYTLQMSYNLTNNNSSDPIHGNNLFNYGYIGSFDHSENPVTGPVRDPITQEIIGFEHIGNFYRLDDYTPSDINAPLTNYNSFVEDFDSRNDFPYFNGNRPQALMSIYGLHTNVNDIYNRIDKSESHRYQFNAKGLFEIVPRGNSKGKHTIEFGIMYEQRVDRFHVILPRRLWEIGRQLTNVHFNDLDTNDIIGQIDAGGGIFVDQYANLAQDSIWAAEDPENRTDGQSYFDKSLRAALGAGRKEWIDIDVLNPDQLSLNYFSATELTNAQIVNYYGYDYLGNKTGGEVSFNDFFLEKDENGEYTRNISPNQPIYTAAYIEDKFLFKDIIFRIGLRVDRYDANTRTLKDNFSLYDAFTASEIGGDIPGAVSGDAVVYTDDGTQNGSVTAYRDGDVWYTSDGTAVNSPINIFGVDQARPALVKQNDNIQAANFDPNSTFVDAEPSINFMPRLAFSFPISEEANFFAHYDVLTQRPPSNSLATPLTYFYFLDNIQSGAQFNNPNLRPERTIDYEVGFQQKLSASSAIKMSAYYKELRDMIQSQTFLYAFPSSYDGFGNQDFGTVKGFNFSYDMRRTGNISIRATYTLQFAEGTGSDANSQRGISNRGNLRVIYPLGFDERHRVTSTIDYRYGSGNKYNGPTVAGRQIFANAGVNLTVIGASGRPYTAALIPQTLGGSGAKGGINGARLPWNTTLNLRVDKDFTLVEPTKDKKGMYLNVYFRVQNVLDQRNVVGVYPFTGSPDDDGFVASPQGQNIVNNTIDPASYLLSYQWRLLNPGFYTLPRRMFVGALVNF